MTPAPAARSPAPSSGDLRELRLEEAVTLALEKNLDIQVAKLEPQSVDFQIAGVPQHLSAGAFDRPSACAISTSCRPASLNGGTKVNNGTTTYNFGLSQNVSKYGGSYTRQLDQLARRDVEHLLDLQPQLPDQPGRGLHAAAAARLQDRQHAAAVADQT